MARCKAASVLFCVARMSIGGCSRRASGRQVRPDVRYPLCGEHNRPVAPTGPIRPPHLTQTRRGRRDGLRPSAPPGPSPPAARARARARVVWRGAPTRTASPPARRTHGVARATCTAGHARCQPARSHGGTPATRPRRSPRRSLAAPRTSCSAMRVRRVRRGRLSATRSYRTPNFEALAFHFKTLANI